MKRSCRAALLALLVFVLVFTAAAQAQVAPSKALFLIARPGMPDPNFRESVVLVVQSQGGEATGVIINRPTDRSPRRAAAERALRSLHRSDLLRRPGGPAGAVRSVPGRQATPAPRCRCSRESTSRSLPIRSTRCSASRRRRSASSRATRMGAGPAAGRARPRRLAGSRCRRQDASSSGTRRACGRTW